MKYSGKCDCAEVLFGHDLVNLRTSAIEMKLDVKLVEALDEDISAVDGQQNIKIVCLKLI
jgi:hypothetical protein